jgi:MEMO1 family protein
MELPADRPRLRPLDFKPIVYEGMQYLHLRDPLNLGDRNLLIPEPFIPVLPLLDGSRDLKAVQFSLVLRHNLRISKERLQEILSALDEACLLDNETYRSARQRAVDEYNAAPFRRSPMAGEAYPDAPEELSAYLDQFLSAAGVTLDSAAGPDYRGLLSPHIDYERGGPVYASAWTAAARAARAAQLVVIFGTDHFSEGFPLSLTCQAYATPYGPLPLPRALVNRLAAILGKEQAFAGELHHRSEHSIDLASVWLHYIRQGQPVEMLPVLVGDLDALPGAQLDRIVETIQRESRRRRILVVAAGDLAHIGPAFGGKPVPQSALGQFKADDERILTLLETSSAAALQAELHALESNNVCGAHPLYLTARILGTTRIDRLGYAACPADEENTSFVTVAGAGLY